nr:PEP-CTERM sorting domain-containing protein [uncultured Desulfobacter sp.]
MKTKKDTVLTIFLFSILLLSIPIFASAETFEDGGGRLLDLQNNDGGWDWPLDDGSPTNNSPTNTAAPIARGLLSAYARTGTSEYLTQAIAAGEFIKTNSPPHSTGNGLFMNELSKATGDTSYAADVKTKYYDALATGNYTNPRDGLNYDTSGYATYIYDLRENQYTSGYSGQSAYSYRNLGLWDVGLAAAGAAVLGVAQSELEIWQERLEYGLENIWSGSYDDTHYNSVLGLSGAVLGLSEIGLGLTDPLVSTNVLNGATSIEDLADILAGFQADSGGFSNFADYVEDDYTDVQETAYAIIALASVDAERYADQIDAAAAWLMDVQLSTGGWAGGWTGAGSENNELTGEALWAVQTAVPEPATMMLVGLGLVGIVGLTRKS